MSPPCDVAVIGAGPVGCAAALAHARAGHRVLLLEASRRPPTRLAGEWIHPGGVAVLRRLGVGTPAPSFLPALGFILHPEDSSPPITLPCPRGDRAATARHCELVATLRAVAADDPAITLALGTRITSIRRTTVTYTREGGPERHARVWRVVGADGQSSVVRRTIHCAAPATTVSRTAGVLLRGLALPAEGYGHVFAGGPGPVLAYRLDDDTVRVTVDVPLSRRRAAELPSYVRRVYSPFLPADLAGLLCTALERKEAVQWAANRVRLRTFHGREPHVLVGDAVGTCHPLTASGLTIGLRDAECLAGTEDVTAHGRRRRAAVRPHEHLAAALHRIFCDPGRTTRDLRRSMYAVLRASGTERERMMRLLCAEELGPLPLTGAVLHVAGHALHEQLVTGRCRTNPWRTSVQACGDYLGWLRWMSRPPGHGWGK
ncbi:FAD-dependent monooxygenase [Streptomyces rectiverticillatus]|uniref:FAD-dependent oxidoreductase n=1 Tax=Streptomyces rectiverticillatus TaxID=173860 RepID=UPI0015C3CC4C|nr:NAD(P)/FAD-dependent oxidoreductase [Streptomyces rectiverticillatus]QLE70261.1 FAD-dependent monooxygenase [Streptomyces rectiverticillatus]